MPTVNHDQSLSAKCRSLLSAANPSLSGADLDILVELAEGVCQDFNCLPEDLAVHVCGIGGGDSGSGTGQRPRGVAIVPPANWVRG